MDESNTSAPDKDQPHPFQASPEVPVVYPRSGAMLQETAVAEGTVLHQPSALACALCGAPQGDQIHIEGKAQADAESPNWG
jgi:hypothetical protein